MKKTRIYIYFYFFTLINIAVSFLISSGLSILLLVLTDRCIGHTTSTIQLTTDLKIFGFIFYLLPVLIFLFQLIQDGNYAFMHHIGYRATERPLASYRGIHFPQFETMDLQHSPSQKQIKKSKYALRFFSIAGWALSALVGELFFVTYLVVCMIFKQPFQPIIPLLLVVLIEILFFALWEKLQKKQKRQIAYIENQRIFYYQKNN